MFEIFLAYPSPALAQEVVVVVLTEEISVKD